MLKLKKLFIAACFIFFAGLAYADNLSNRVQATAGSVKNSAVVVQTQNKAGSYWERFTKWFKNLPLVRDYLKSTYAPGNYKKAMNQMSEEYKPHLTPKSDKGL